LYDIHQNFADWRDSRDLFILHIILICPINTKITRDDMYAKIERTAISVISLGCTLLLLCPVTRRLLGIHIRTTSGDTCHCFSQNPLCYYRRGPNKAATFNFTMDKCRNRFHRAPIILSVLLLTSFATDVQM
jgi:hypothetical protein